MKFNVLKSTVKQCWPTTISWKEKFQLINLEEVSSQKMIGLDHEFLYRTLSYSLLIYFLESKISSPVPIESVDWQRVKAVFNIEMILGSQSMTGVHQR